MSSENAVSKKLLYIVKEAAPSVVKLEDGTTLALRVAATSVKVVREESNAPFDGVKFETKQVTGVDVIECPKELREKVKYKDVVKDNNSKEVKIWERVGVVEANEAVETLEVKLGEKTYEITIHGEPMMVARSVSHRDPEGNPIYVVDLAKKVTWKAKEE